MEAYKFKTKPFDHQLKAFERSKDQENFALLMEQGTGKSKVAIDTMGYLYLKGKIDAAVVIAPKGCYLNWQKDEIPTHLSDQVYRHVETWTAPSGQSAAKSKSLKSFLESPSGLLKILLVNVEALSSDPGVNYLLKFLKKHEALVIVDESTTIRIPSSRRYKSSRAVAKLAAYRRILTGTPVAERPLDLYGQCAFLDPNLLGHPNFFAFKHYYANFVNVPLQAGRFYPKLLGYRRLDELCSRLDSFSFRVLKVDCLDLPPKVYQTRYVELTEEQLRAYNDMAKRMVAEINGEQATANLVLTKMMRLQSIVCGHLRLDNQEIIDLPHHRITALQEVLEEVSGKVIIWCLYRKDAENVCRALGDKAVEYHGGIDDEGREVSKERFKNDPSVLYFVSTPKVGGKGNTLVNASTVIYYSQDYSLENRQQTEDRAHRIGQKESVTYIDLIAAGTIDEKIVNAVKDKKNLADSILDGIQSFIKPI